MSLGWKAIEKNDDLWDGGYGFNEGHVEQKIQAYVEWLLQDVTDKCSNKEI